MLRLTAMDLFWEFAPIIAAWFAVWIIVALASIWFVGRSGRK